MEVEALLRVDAVADREVAAVHAVDAHLAPALDGVRQFLDVGPHERVTDDGARLALPLFLAHA